MGLLELPAVSSTRQSPGIDHLCWMDSSCTGETIGCRCRWPRRVGGPTSKGFHARADFCVERFGSKRVPAPRRLPRARAADLTLVEPDCVYEALDCRVEIGVVEDNERRFAAQLKRKLARRVSGDLADDAAHFSGAGEGDLVDVRMRRRQCLRASVVAGRAR